MGKIIILISILAIIYFILLVWDCYLINQNKELKKKLKRAEVRMAEKQRECNTFIARYQAIKNTLEQTDNHISSAKH